MFELENLLPQAEAAYRSALAADEKLLVAAARLAVVLMNQRRDADAIEVASRALVHDPGYVFPSLVRERPLSLWSVLGDAYRLSGNLTAASALYRQAARVEPGGSFGSRHAATAMLGVGDLDGATELEGSDAKGILGLLRVAQSRDEDLPAVREIAQEQFIAAAESSTIGKG